MRIKPIFGYLLVTIINSFTKIESVKKNEIHLFFRGPSRYFVFQWKHVHVFGPPFKHHTGSLALLFQ